jgi:hypothetical protein
MKARVENVLERGKVGEKYINEEPLCRALSRWTDGSFTRQDHPTVIQVCIIHALVIIICANIYLHNNLRVISNIHLVGSNATYYNLITLSSN